MSWDEWIGPYVDDLVERRHIRSERVARAFRRVPRHRCIAAYYARGGRRVVVPQGEGAVVPDEVLAYLYSDSAPVTKLEGDRPVSSSTGPAQMAEMLEALDLRGGERVLEIGAGTGYNAALLAEITGAEVVTVDRALDVVAGARASLGRLGEGRVTVVTGDGFHGHADGAPYDRVIVTVGPPGIAEPWMDQLALGGFVVAPVLLAGAHPVLRVERGPPWTARGRGVCWTDFMVGGGALAHRDPRIFGSPADWGPFTLDAPKAVRRFDPVLDDHAYEGLTAYVTVADRRAGPRAIEGLDPDLGNCVVRDRRTGATAVFQRTGVVVDGPDSFADAMQQLTDRWLRRGSPPFADWRFELTLDELPSGRFWRPHRLSLADAGTGTGAGGDAGIVAPPGEAVLRWFVDVALDSFTAGVRSAVRWQAVDVVSDALARGRERDPAVGIRRAFDAAARVAEGLRGVALDEVSDLVAEEVRRAGAPRWVAIVAGQVVARLVLSPVDRPLQVAGLVLRVIGRAIEEAGLGATPHDLAPPQVRTLLLSTGFRKELRLLVTEGFRGELRLLLGPITPDQRAEWERFIAQAQDHAQVVRRSQGHSMGRRGMRR